MNKFSYRKRAFLSPVATGFTSYVLAEVESSENGQYCGGSNVVRIADCRRCIELEFVLSTAIRRRQSLAKIDLLVEILTAFRSALKVEAKLLTDYDRGIAREARRNFRRRRIA